MRHPHGASCLANLWTNGTFLLLRRIVSVNSSLNHGFTNPHRAAHHPHCWPTLSHLKLNSIGWHMNNSECGGILNFVKKISIWQLLCGLVKNKFQRTRSEIYRILTLFLFSRVLEVQKIYLWSCQCKTVRVFEDMDLHILILLFNVVIHTFSST